MTAGETATVRLDPRQQALRVYLAPAGARIRAAASPGLHFVGVLPRGRRALTFTVPPLESGTYRVWCAGCDARVRLRVRTPTASCPVTAGRARYGNGLLSTGGLPADGTVVVTPDRIDERGLFWTKLGWRVRPWKISWGTLSVAVRRLDAPGPARSIETLRGDSDNWWSWAARMWFPSEGCYRVTGRVEDLALSFVVRVIVG